MEDQASRTLTVERDFDAPARTLFEAHSTPARLRARYGPGPFKQSACEIDFRVGGRIALGFTGPDGAETPSFGGVYSQIVPDWKIVRSNGFDYPGAEQMTFATLFGEVGGRTTLTQHFTFDSEADLRKYLGMGMEDGIRAKLDQLEVYAATLTG